MESNGDSFSEPRESLSSISTLSSNQTPSKPLLDSQNKTLLGPNSLSFTILASLKSNALFQNMSTAIQVEESANEDSNQETAPKPEMAKCQYCNIDFVSAEIQGHIDDCDMRKINCEKCGERVLMDIFDYHFEDCGANQGEEMDPSSEMYVERNEEENSDGGMEEEESEMTYERLLLLDANAVSKGMTQEQIKEFRELLYVKSLDGEGSCVICMSDYQTGEYTRKLSCAHSFHKNCIDQWLGSNYTCPTCKKHLR